MGLLGHSLSQSVLSRIQANLVVVPSQQDSPVSTGARQVPSVA